MQQGVCGKLFGCNGLRRKGQISPLSARISRKKLKNQRLETLPIREIWGLEAGAGREFLTSIVTIWVEALRQRAGRNLKTLRGGACWVPYSGWYTVCAVQ